MRRHNLRDHISKLYGFVYHNNHITGVFDQYFAFGNRDNQHPFGVFNLDIYTKLKLKPASFDCVHKLTSAGDNDNNGADNDDSDNDYADHDNNDIQLLFIIHEELPEWNA